MKKECPRCQGKGHYWGGYYGAETRICSCPAGKKWLTPRNKKYEMELHQHEVDSFKILLEQPEANGLDFPALSDLFEETEQARDRRELYRQYLDRIGRNKNSIPMTLFFRIMDDLYKQKPTKDGELGYCVRLIE